EVIRRHGLAAERLHGDDTTVPVLAKDKTAIGRVWAYVRDDRPFAGPDRGGELAAAIYTLIGTAKLNGVDPQAWLADVLRRIADHPASQLHQLLPWHWKPRETRAAAA